MIKLNILNCIFSFGMTIFGAFLHRLDVVFFAAIGFISSFLFLVLEAIS